MKRTLITAIVATSLLLGLNACQKYEEGPIVSFRSKFDRVVNTWKAKNVFRGDVDVTAWYADWQLDLMEDGRLVLTDRDVLDSLVTQEGFWDLANDNDDLQFLYTDPPVSNDRSTVEILKLMEEELWYAHHTDTVVWQFRLVPAFADAK